MSIYRNAGLVSWVENSSLPSKSMVLAEMASLTYPKACLDVLQAVKVSFPAVCGVTSSRQQFVEVNVCAPACVCVASTSSIVDV